jgi:hypothetical protein
MAINRINELKMPKFAGERFIESASGRSTARFEPRQSIE